MAFFSHFYTPGNNLERRNVVLVELTGSHDECMYSMMKIYNALDYEVHIVASSELIGRFERYQAIKSIEFFDIPKGRLNYFGSLLKIRKYLKSINPDLIYLNTAANNIMLDLLLVLGKKYKYTGLLHSVQKLNQSNTQNLISKYISKYYVLMDYLLDFVPIHMKNRVDSLYLVYNTIDDNNYPKSDELQICIPGQIEFKRRDYRFLLDLAASKELNPKIKFVILGNINQVSGNGSEFVKLAESKGITNRFITFDRFISPGEFLKYVATSDLIMPLLHPNVDFFNNYLTNQISGSFIHSFTHRVPMLINKEFEIIDDILDSSFIYDDRNAIEILNLLASNHELIKKKKNQIATNPKFDFDKQLSKL